MTSKGPEKDNLIAETDHILSDEKYANQMDPTYGITHFQLHALRLLSTDDKYELQENQKALVHRFIDQAMGNMELNKNLLVIKTMDLSKSGLNHDVIKNFHYFSFKTRNIKDFPSILEKVIKNQNRIDNKMELAEEHKITLREYSIFSDIVKLKSTFDFLHKKVDYKNDSHGNNLHQNVKKGNEIALKLEEACKANIKDSPGMIVFNDSKKIAKAHGATLSLFETFVVKYITKYGHASKLYKDAKKQAIMSHINPAPEDDKFQLRDFLYADVYQIKIDKLISSDNQKKLEEVYGPEWKAKINESYSLIERRIHDNTVQKFSHLRSQTKSAQNKAGFANFLPTFIGNKKIKKTNFDSIHRSIINKHYETAPGKMLCSEFVAVTTIAAMIELNKEFKKEADKKNINISANCIDIPFSKHEKLHNILPDRLLSVLSSKGCVEKVKKADEIKRYFIKK